MINKVELHFETLIKKLIMDADFIFDFLKPALSQDEIESCKAVHKKTTEFCKEEGITKRALLLTILNSLHAYGELEKNETLPN